MQRLRDAGHELSVSLCDAAEPGARQLDLALALGRRGFGLAGRASPLPSAGTSSPDLVIDLTGSASRDGLPTLRVTFGGAQTLPNGLAGMFAEGSSADVVAELDGVAVGRAAPMLEDRVWLGRMADVILSATITLIVATVQAYFEKRSAPVAVSPAPSGAGGLLSAYLPRFAGGLAQRAWHRIARKEAAPWCTAYRFIDGPGVAETGSLEGSPFTVLPDDGKRFYADPFVIEHDGRPVLFVEEFPYAS